MEKELEYLNFLLHNASHLSNFVAIIFARTINISLSRENFENPFAIAVYKKTVMGLD